MRVNQLVFIVVGHEEIRLLLRRQVDALG